MQSSGVLGHLVSCPGTLQHMIKRTLKPPLFSNSKCLSLAHSNLKSAKMSCSFTGSKIVEWDLYHCHTIVCPVPFYGFEGMWRIQLKQINFSWNSYMVKRRCADTFSCEKMHVSTSCFNWLLATKINNSPGLMHWNVSNKHNMTVMKFQSNYQWNLVKL